MQRGPFWDEPAVVHVLFRCGVCHARWALAFEAAGDLRTLEGPDPAPPEHDQVRLKVVRSRE